MADPPALRGRPRGSGHTSGRRSGEGCPVAPASCALAGGTARRTFCRWYDRYLEGGPEALDLALVASGCASANVHHRPRLLSDNGPCYIAGELAEYIKAQRMIHVRGAPFHPQTQGKIPSRGLQANRCQAAERWHQTMKNRILLENYFRPGDLEAQIEAFVEHYNHRRYHQSLKNVTPADAYFGRASDIIKQRERIKRKTIEHRRLQHRKRAA